ncbi:MAG: hypothetical protein R3C55_07425 [Parvularculaceae bacterium]
MLEIVAWASWGVLLAALLIALMLDVGRPRHTPEVSRGMGAAAIGLVLALLMGAGGLLYWLGRAESRIGLAVMAVLLAYPACLLAARPAVLAWKMRRAKAAAMDENDEQPQ